MSPKRLAAIAVIVLAAIAVGGGALASHANGAAVHRMHGFHGSVARIGPGHHWLHIHTVGHGPMRFWVHDATHWDGCDWNRMHKGDTVSIRAYHSHHMWVATRIGNWHHRGMHHGMPGMHHGD